jgi:hypothetical protein
VALDVAALVGERFPKPHTRGENPYREARTRVSLAPGGEADFSIDADFAPESLTIDPDVIVLQLGRKGATTRL